LGPRLWSTRPASVASFNAVVKVADGSGIRVDDSRRETAAKMRAELKLDFGLR